MDAGQSASTTASNERTPDYHSQTNVYRETQEKGVINTHHGTTRFLGSSSGVHFLQNVRQAFFLSSGTSALAFDEESLLEEDLSSEGENTVIGSNGNTKCPTESAHESFTLELGQKLIMPYFRYYHPILPFLDGKQVRNDLHRIADGENIPVRNMMILRVVFTIGLLDYPELRPTADPVCYKNAAHALSYVNLISAKYDLQTIQSLLAIQVFLLAKMFLQSSYELSGLIRSKIYLAGLHRCPARYPQFGESDCMERKRIYWSAYSIDRQLSQLLGLPNGYQDSDVDVCALDAEYHMVGLDLPLADSDPKHLIPESLPQLKKMEVAIMYSQYGMLIGKVLEMFNKAIHSRQVARNSVLELKSEIEAWRNRLPYSLVDDRYESSECPFENISFFNTIYCHLNILTHRPRLSLSPGSPEFKFAIQVCIENSRTILLELTWQCQRYPNQHLFWPGYLSMVWMSGLMLAYASKLGYYPPERAKDEMAMCIPLCERMAKRWTVAERCQIMLRTLANSVGQPALRASIRAYNERAADNEGVDDRKSRDEAQKDGNRNEGNDGFSGQSSAQNNANQRDRSLNHENHYSAEHGDVKRFKSDHSSEHGSAEVPDFLDMNQFAGFDDVFELFNNNIMWKE